MASVFLLQHCHLLASGDEDLKTIGVYTSRQQARAAVERVKAQPGFCDHPRVVDPEVDDDPNGFYIDEYTLDEDNWCDGYAKV